SWRRRNRRRHPQCRRHWQADDELCAATDALAECLDRAAVRLDQMAHDREPETETSMRARRAHVLLAKPLEDVREEIGRDPLPRVLDREDAGAGIEHRRADAR